MNRYIISKTLALVPKSMTSEMQKRFIYTIPEIPYLNTGIKNFISTQSLKQHLKIHKDDVEKANNFVQRTPWEETTINQAIVQSFNSIEDAPFFEAVSSHYNHSFFWRSLSNIKQNPSLYMKKALELDFGSFGSFQQKFSQTASALNVPGFAWLVFHDKTLRVITTFGSGSPLELHNCYPLLCLDLYEHSYMMDHGNDKNKYIANFWANVNWKFVEKKFLNALVADRDYKLRLESLAGAQSYAFEKYMQEKEGKI
ncbi:hypothetical protein RB653_003023 [Dictyostelium firmibasis]|uniref:Superoxide dismutase n=1 Tax=Dictyostelium firmibasis TaxID=79012 RepID=A0AAN7U3U9_9MYCE